MPSSIPGAVDALLALAAQVLPDVEQVEGELGTYVAPEQFHVLDVIGEEQPRTVGLPRLMAESYGITCLVRTYAGDVNMRARRMRALAMKDAIRDGLLADPSMSGSVYEAYVSTFSLRTGTTDKGGSASEVEFVVHVDSYNE